MDTKEKTAIEKVQKARHPRRPYTNDLIRGLFNEFTEIHGDRRFADDPAMVCGFAKLDELKVAVIGQQKGRDTNQRRFRNFGMPKPEGYRKALRVMKLAEKFERPLITFIDTPGAYPGIDAEERGQAEAIAYNLREMSSLKIPTLTVVVGEGGSGGALAIGICDRVLMMENSVYSVISPEGCAAILWKNSEKSAEAAACLKLTPEDLQSGSLIDFIIDENLLENKSASDNIWDVNNGEEIFVNLKESLLKNIIEIKNININKLLADRYEKFRNMGRWNK